MLQRRGLIAISILILILCVGVASAELYKWKGDDGRVFYSEQAPPGKKAEVMDYSDSKATASADKMPIIIQIINRQKRKQW